VLASAPIAIVSTVFLLGYQLLAGPPPPMMALLLPLYWMVFAIYCIGFALLLAALNVFMRDLSEIIGIVFSAGLFLSPILFIPGLAPPWLEQVYHFNPFSYAIWVHRDIVFHGAITEPSAWIGFGFLSAGLFVAGAALFSRLEDHFGDAL
jgi:lipopolysaccharide transport system permease protein